MKQKSIKLHGYEFWRSINSPKYVCAPMVSQSDHPFRLLVQEYGCELMYSPMIYSDQYIRCKPKSTQIEKSKNYRDGCFRTCKKEGPLFAQFCGNNPEIILEAARDFEDDVDAIDINFGCPQQIAKKGNYGSYLLDQPDTVTSIISHLHKNLKIPVTAKIRILPNDPEGTIQLALKIQKAGASVLTVHGRAKEEKQQFVGACNWELIKKIKEALDIPVIANGGIYNFNDVQNCLKLTGCDAVMSCEGLLEYPALFSGRNDIDIDVIAQQYIQICETHPPSELHFIKGHLFKFYYAALKNTKHEKEAENIQKITQLQTNLAKSKTVDDYKQVVNGFLELRKNQAHYEKRGYYFRWFGENQEEMVSQTTQVSQKLQNQIIIKNQKDITNPESAAIILRQVEQSMAFQNIQELQLYDTTTNIIKTAMVSNNNNDSNSNIQDQQIQN